MPIIHDPLKIPGRTGSIYPAPFDKACKGRLKRALTQALGLTQFGINMTTLEPGAKSSLRHWHANEDEAIYVVTGEVTMIDDNGEHKLGPGMIAGYPAGEQNAHHLVNKSNASVTYLEIGTRCKDEYATYADVDLVGRKREGEFTFYRKDGSRYE